ncbi:hypothetical protein OG21DRAFT_148636 [Imleria badia]|nr:hypothetical protein OG21DRAFT_148636 [Imleria badia]
MPSEIHEAPLQHLDFRLQTIVNSMPLKYGESKVIFRTHRNTTVRGTTSDIIPDIHLSVGASGVPSSSPLRIRRRFFFVECAFSETDAHVDEKLRSLIEDYPDALAVMKIKITEYRHPFPSSTSPIAKKHASQPVPSKTQLLPHPIDPINPISAMYDGIALLDVQSVSIELWIRDYNSELPIDFDSRANDVYAKGTIHPHQSTEAVDLLLSKFMLQMQTLAVSYAEQLVRMPTQSSSGAQTDMSIEVPAAAENWLRTLRRWVPPQRLFDWTDVIDVLEESTVDIAQVRYDNWCNVLKRPKGESSSDDEHVGPVAATSGAPRRSKRLATQDSSTLQSV